MRALVANLRSRLSRSLIAPIAVAVMVMGCGGPDVRRYEAILDELAIPADWELVETRIQAPGSENSCTVLFPSCPSVARYYLVDGQPIDFQPIAKEFLVGAGFHLDEELGPDCDIPPSGAACVLVGSRGSDLLRSDARRVHSRDCARADIR